MAAISTDNGLWMPTINVEFYLLCLLNLIFHGEEDAVNENGQHHKVVKVLVSAEVDGRRSHRVPRREDPHGPRGREPLHVVLLKAPGHHAKRLKKYIRDTHVSELLMHETKKAEAEKDKGGKSFLQIINAELPFRRRKWRESEREKGFLSYYLEMNELYAA